MIAAILHPHILERLRNDNTLKLKLAEQNEVRISAIEARLRPQVSGMPHSQNLTNAANLETIAKDFKMEVPELYEVMDIEIK